MSDADPFAEHRARVDAGRRLEAEILPHNKQVLFDALASAGIVLVTIEFDGYGDEGAFREPAGFNAEHKGVALPEQPITVQTVNFELGAVGERTIKAAEFIDTLAYDLLESCHSGWENNDGAFGEFQLAVADRTITLDYQERYTEIDSHRHEF